jgi:ABC-2 type transport system ATP-binding protein
MDEAEQLCSRFLVLRNGAIVATGSLAELRVAAGLADASLDELFGYFTGDEMGPRRHDGPTVRSP